MILLAFADNTPVTDQQFFTELYIRYEPLLFSTAWKYTKDAQAVEDIVQDSVEKLIKKISILKTLNRYTLVSYIVNTVRNTAINYIHREGLKNTYFVAEPDDTSDFYDLIVETNPEIIYLNTEFSEATWEALSNLPDKYMVLLKGKYILGLDDEELAELICCKPSSVRMYLTRARRKAMELLVKGEFTYD